MWMSPGGGSKEERTRSEERLVLVLSAMFEDSVKTSVAGIRLREVGKGTGEQVT